MTGPIETVSGRGHPALPWFRGPRPHLGRGEAPFAHFPIPTPVRPSVVPPTPRIIIPRYIDLLTWANQMVQCFPASQVPVLINEEDWREWGEILISRAAFTRFQAPSPHGFDDWQSWAEALILTLPYGT